MPTRLLSDRRGVALPLALFTLVIAAVMITAVFYVGRLEQRMGNNSVAATQAFEAAETGVTEVMNGWSPGAFNSIATGATLALPTVAVGPNATYTATIRRLNNQLYLIQAEGRFLVGGQAVTRRQVARVVRLDAASILPEAAVINRVNLDVSGTSVDGGDLVPVGWSGCSAGPDVPAIVDSSGAVTTTGACSGGSCLTGSSPQLVVDPVNVNSSTFTTFAGMTYSDMVAVADKSVLGTHTPGPTYDPGPSCRIGDIDNWGAPEDPSGPCGQYFPIIHATGNLDLVGGTGQGILLVDGDLTLDGPLRFYGIVVVNGAVDLHNGQIVGTIFINNIAGAPSTISATNIRYSRCAINRATARASQPKPMAERSWMQLY